MVKRLGLLGLLLMLGIDLTGCGGFQPCDAPARQSVGACSIGKSKDTA
jgi:hypothetical protein